MSDIGKGYVQIYTGDGKGKTTAALGLALRAAGSGLKVCIVQFMKGRHYSELDAARLMQGLVTIEQYGHPTFCRFTDPPDPKDVSRARDAFDRLRDIMTSKSCDVLIADEIVTAVKFSLIAEREVLELMNSRPDGMELVLTGRGATQGLIDAADLVTEMREVKHYYTKGVPARRGIES
ncbi:MAG: cob(I)yrinic acid a,c-diamide adenosyltransferase [Bacteriovoracaceae bacterium]|jgi:cob(I)alamin adenosyltransferase|nr:cob(I)yrinic acid a,c-diamide adenosyltransferase [Bacteriovoracaceae bacterium]